MSPILMIKLRNHLVWNLPDRNNCFHEISRLIIIDDYMNAIYAIVYKRLK